MDVRPITGTFGAEIEGVDLAQLDDPPVAKLRDAFLEHKVLVFRDQHSLTPEGQVTLAGHFGELEILPGREHVEGYPGVMVLRSNGTESVRETWHSDLSWSETPALGSILRAVDVPPYGRDTLFADMEAAYAGLSIPMRRAIADLSAMHDHRQAYVGAEHGPRAHDEPPPVEHPVVRTHPETGRTSLYVSHGFTTQLVGMRQNESDMLLRFLCDQVHQPEYQLRCAWRPGTVVMWDNRCVQHAFVNDRAYPRVMHRVTIAGDRPFSAS